MFRIYKGVRRMRKLVCHKARSMLLLSKALISLLLAVPSWFALFSSGHEIQVRIPVWNVGNIFSAFAKSSPSSTTRHTTRSTRPTKTTPPGTPPTKPTNPTHDICDIYPQLPACQEESNPPEPSICDTYPQLPLCQEESNPPEPSICDTYPQLPLCQEESNPPEPSICDTYPQLPLCQEVRNVGSAKRTWATVPNFCLYYPNSCPSPEESPIVPIVDAQGRSALLILPRVRGRELPESGRSSTEWLGPTRRPAWQRQSNKHTSKINHDK